MDMRNSDPSNAYLKHTFSIIDLYSKKQTRLSANDAHPV